MSWLGRLTQGLSKTSSNISTGITDIFTKKRLDDEMLEELEELLIQADVGAANAAKVVAEFSEGRFDKEIEAEEVRNALADVIATRLEPIAKDLSIDAAAKPHVIVVVGVNGNGKTTTVGKMAHLLNGNGYRVMMAAADTFRAAAMEQLAVWAERVGCPIIAGEERADPASVAYRAMEEAKAQGSDVLLIDTAGRLHNKANLMEELSKILRVIKKVDESAPHTILQVLDATTGQNALQQVQAFKDLVDVNGLVVTKLDGSAKAGMVIALAEQCQLPIHAIGVGESIEDFQPFTAQDFAKSLMAE